MMNRINKISLLLVAALLVIICHSCYKDGDQEPNPFEENMIGQDTVNLALIDADPVSIAGLYQNIFGQTCANSGCHDGTFEPDFRSMESSYHSMVYKTPIKNDGSLTYRVDPGNPDQSALIKRITGAITPQMPIDVEPDSDWPDNAQTYIQNIRDWIADGAKDMSGNSPDFDHINPTILGLIAEIDGMPILRQGGFGPFMVPDSMDMVTFYISFDPINNPQDFLVNQFVLGYEQGGFVEMETLTMEIMDTPLISYGMLGLDVTFTHKVDVNINLLSLTGEHIFIRTKVQDESNSVTEIPTNDAFYNFKEYMSFILVD